MDKGSIHLSWSKDTRILTSPLNIIELSYFVTIEVYTYVGLVTFRQKN